MIGRETIERYEIRNQEVERKRRRLGREDKNGIRENVEDERITKKSTERYRKGENEDFGKVREVRDRVREKEKRNLIEKYD